jgi:hypothetical protein
MRRSYSSKTCPQSNIPGDDAGMNEKKNLLANEIHQFEGYTPSLYMGKDQSAVKLINHATFSVKENKKPTLDCQ